MSTRPDALQGRLPFYSTLGEEGRRLLARGIRTVHAAPGSTLLSQGDPVAGVYFIEAGAVRVHYLDAQGHDGTLYRLEPGEACVLALNCVFSEFAYPAWADAEEEGASLLVLDGHVARELARVDPAFLKALFTHTASRLYQVLVTLEQALRLPLEARLARLLLDLAGEGSEVCLPHERLASHLGTSREVVSRIIRALAKEGLVESHYGKVTIRAPELLAARCR